MLGSARITDQTILIRTFFLLIGTILGLSHSGVVWSAKGEVQPSRNGLIAFADAPGSKLGPEPWAENGGEGGIRTHGTL